METEGRRIERAISAIVLLLLATGSLLVIWPFITAIIWAIVQSFTAWPIYRRVLAWTGGRRSVAALIMMLGSIVILLLPVMMIGTTVADNAQGLGSGIKHWMESGVSEPPAWVSKIPLVGA